MDYQIRHLEAEDAEAIRDILNSMTTIHGSMRVPYPSLESTRERVKPKEGVIKLVACHDETVVGFSELITNPDVPRHSHASEINMIAVHENWQCKGVGRALMEAMIDLADNWLNLRRVGLTVWKDNEHAIRLYEKCGFSVEGTMRDYVFRRGEYIDAILMSRLRAN